MRRLTMAVLLVALLTGCSYIRAGKHLDFSPFAEHTISLASEIDYSITESGRSLQLKEFWYDPEIEAHRVHWTRIRKLLRSVVSYSVEVTTLGSSQLTGPERCQALADFLQPLATPVMAAKREYLHISESQMDSILVKIRSQKSLVAAMGEAQPVIDEVTRLAGEVFDDARLSLDETARHLSKRIDETNSDVLLYRKLIRDGQYRVFQNIVLLGRYRNGDSTALPELFEGDPQLREYAASDEKLTLAEIQAIEERLFLKGSKLREFGQQLQPDIERYYAQRQELADLYTDAAHQLRRAKVTMIVWSRVHRDLAAGITDPAKINLMDLTKKAVDMAL